MFKFMIKKRKIHTENDFKMTILIDSKIFSLLPTNCFDLTSIEMDKKNYN